MSEHTGKISFWRAGLGRHGEGELTTDCCCHGGDRATDSPAAGEEAARVCCTRGKSLRGYEKKPSVLQVHNRGEFSENLSFLVPRIRVVNKSCLF